MEEDLTTVDLEAEERPKATPLSLPFELSAWRRPDARARVVALSWQTLDLRAYHAPHDSVELRRRLAHNLPLYAPVYGGVTVAMLVVAALTNPIVLTSWVLLGIAWGAYAARPNEPTRVGGIVLYQLEKRLLLVVTNLVVLVWGGIVASVGWVLFLSLLGAATHASVRRIEASPPSTQHLEEGKEEDEDEDEGT
jgi:hypothetical protein